MKAMILINGLLFLLLMTGCKKEKEEKPEEVHRTFPPPAWKVDAPGQYPASMTAVVSLPATLQNGMANDDQLAAFVGETCRGVGEKVKVGTTDLYFVMIRGTGDEQSKVVFKYYSAKTSYLYQTEPVLNFLVDDVYGTAQNPKVLPLNRVK